MAEIKSNSMTIQPTVFIALGGTGFKVCTKLYDLIDMYVGGAGKYCSCLQFVFIDTAVNKVVCNANSCSLHCSCESSGTDGVRQVGQQAFIKYKDDIKHVIEEAVRKAETLEIVHSSSKLEASGVRGHIRISNGLKFVVVGSIAGGTGGGMLSDLLTLLRDKFAHQGDLDLHILGASHFNNLAGVSTEHSQANAYASLQELDHFNRGDNYLADHIFLYENANNSKKVHDDVDKFCLSLAQLLFRDYTFDLSAQFEDDDKRIKAIISQDYRQTIPVAGYPGLEFTQNFSQRFQSRGYAALVVPHEQMIEAASYRLTREVIECLNGTEKIDVSEEEGELLSELNLLPSAKFDLYALCLEGKITFNREHFFESLPGEEGSIYTLLAALTSVVEDRKQSIRDMANEFGQDDCFMMLKRMEKPIPSTKNDGCQTKIESSVIGAIKSMEDVVSIGGILRKNSYTIIFKLKLQLDILLKDIPEAKRFHAMVNLHSVLTEHIEDINKAIESISKEEYASKEYEELLERLKNITTDKVFGICINQKAKDDDRSVLAKYCYEYKFGKDPKGKDLEGELVSKLLINVLLKLDDVLKELDRYLSEKINQILSNLPIKLESWVNSAVAGPIGIIKVRDILSSLNLELAKIYGPLYYYSLFGERKGLNDKIQDLINCCHKIDKSNLEQITQYLSSQEHRYYTEFDPKTFVYLIENLDSAKVDEILEVCLPNKEKMVIDIFNHFINSFAQGSKNTLRSKLSSLDTFLKEFDPNVDDEYLNNLIDRCRLEFIDTLPEKYNFWKIFRQKYPESAQRHKLIANLCHFSDYWLQQNPQYEFHDDLEGSERKLYSLPSWPDDLPDYRSEIISTINGQIDDIKRIDNPSNHGKLEIIRQSPNVAICYSRYLMDMAKAYDSEIARGCKPLHAQEEIIFTDINLLNDETAQKECLAMETALLGLCFDVIKLEEKEAVYYFSPKDSNDRSILCENCLKEPNFFKKIFVRLCKDTDLCAEIHQCIEERKAAVFANIPQQQTTRAEVTNWECYLRLCCGLAFIKRMNDDNIKAFFNYLFEQCLIHIYVSLNEANSLDSSRSTRINQEIRKLPEEHWNELFYVRPGDGMRIWQA